YCVIRDLYSFPYTTLFRSKNASKRTISAYQDDINHFQAFLQSENILNWQEVNYGIIRHYLTLLYQEGLSRSSVTRHLSSLRSFRSEEHTSELQSRENLVCR